MDQGTVVGEQQQPGRVGVEASDWLHVARRSGAGQAHHAGVVARLARALTPAGFVLGGSRSRPAYHGHASPRTSKRRPLGSTASSAEAVFPGVGHEPGVQERQALAARAETLGEEDVRHFDTLPWGDYLRRPAHQPLRDAFHPARPACPRSRADPAFGGWRGRAPLTIGRTGRPAGVRVRAPGWRAHRLSVPLWSRRQANESLQAQPAPHLDALDSATDGDDARRALEELPEGVERLVDGVRTTGRVTGALRPADKALTGAALDWLMRLPASARPHHLATAHPRRPIGSPTPGQIAPGRWPRSTSCSAISAAAGAPGAGANEIVALANCSSARRASSGPARRAHG